MSDQDKVSFVDSLREIVKNMAKMNASEQTIKFDFNGELGKCYQVTLKVKDFTSIHYKDDEEDEEDDE